MQERELKELIAKTIREVLYEILKSDVSDERSSAGRLMRALLIKADTKPQIEAQEALLFALWSDECKYDSNQIQKILDKLDQILAKLP